MNILIVDNDRLDADRTGRILEKEIPHNLSVCKVKTMSEALAALQHRQISLVLCECRFPGGSGLELAAQIRSRYPETPVIFLTNSHSFELARDAINLGAKGFLNKPANPRELMRSIRMALQSDRQESPLFLRNDFWYKLLYNEAPVILPDYKKHGIASHETSHIFPLLISWRWKKGASHGWNDALVQFLITNVAQEILKDHLKKEDVVLEKNRILFLCNLRDQSPVECSIKYETMLKKCSEYITHCHMSGYVCGTASLDSLRTSVHRLWLFDQRDIRRPNQIVNISQVEPKKLQYQKPDIALWVQQLFTPAYQQGLDSMNRYLNQIRRCDYGNQHLLLCFQADLLQEVFRVLDQKNIPANAALAKMHLKELYDISNYSVDNMSAYLDALVHCLRKCQDPSWENLTLVEKVKSHILKNLESDITRNELAELVFLHPDYLSHIFKDETGMSISDYIMQERLKKSKRLLLSTSEKISEVALNIGYSNAAYFIKLFKKATGMTPKEYRNQARA